MKTFKADNEFFNARDTLESGQIFRYKSINDGFLVLSGDKACRIKDENDAFSGNIQFILLRYKQNADIYRRTGRNIDN